MDYASEQIAQYEERPSIPYFSPAFQVTPEYGPFGVMVWMSEPLHIQTCLEMIVAAPLPPQKSKITHAVRAFQNAGQAPVGQSPTMGIYTGVHEDGCS
jgi:hypothetical protein